MWNVQGFSCKQLVENLIGWINPEWARSNQLGKIINQALCNWNISSSNKQLIAHIALVIIVTLWTLYFSTIIFWPSGFKFSYFLNVRFLVRFNVHFDPWPSTLDQTRLSLFYN